MPSRRDACLWASALILGCASTATAQQFETVGTRAQGMGGAFVAVADDATATWWNPAGLASGNLLSILWETGHTDVPSSVPDAGPGRRESATGFAAAFPSLGLSYYRLRVSEIAPLSGNTGDPEPGRQDQQLPAQVELRTLALNQFGSTVGQSIGNHVIVATTVKYVQAGRTSGSVALATVGDDPLDAASDLEPDMDSEGDIDVGVMVALGWFRAGVTVKHLFEPDFGDGLNHFELEHQARAGVAMIRDSIGPFDRLTLAGDVDITEMPTVNGDVRHAAGGAEVWMFKKRVGLRSGVNVDVEGPMTTSGSVGGTFGGWYGLYINGAWWFGGDDARNGWTTAVSLTF